MPPARRAGLAPLWRRRMADAGSRALPAPETRDRQTTSLHCHLIDFRKRHMSGSCVGPAWLCGRFMPTTAPAAAPSRHSRGFPAAAALHLDGRHRHPQHLGKAHRPRNLTGGSLRDAAEGQREGYWKTAAVPASWPKTARRLLHRAILWWNESRLPQAEPGPRKELTVAVGRVACHGAAGWPLLAAPRPGGGRY